MILLTTKQILELQAGGHRQAVLEAVLARLDDVADRLYDLEVSIAACMTDEDQAAADDAPLPPDPDDGVPF